MKKIIKPVLILTFVALFCGVLLYCTNEFTYPIITKNGVNS